MNNQFNHKHFPSNQEAQFYIKKAVESYCPQLSEAIETDFSPFVESAFENSSTLNDAFEMYLDNNKRSAWASLVVSQVKDALRFVKELSM